MDSQLASCRGGVTVAECDDCKGKGTIELFTSVVDCEKCGGGGDAEEKLSDYFEFHKVEFIEVFLVKGDDP